jgi:hypothetical protein
MFRLLILSSILISSIISYPVNNINNIGGCSGTQHGCCSDNITPCMYSNCTNCMANIGGCFGTQYGCCSDNITPCIYSNCTNCKYIII